MKRIDVMIADDHPMIISGIISMLQNFRHIHICGAYSTGNALLEGLHRHRPKVLLLDILLPDISGKELAVTIRDLYPEINILVLTSMDAPVLVSSMLQKGCKGYLLKGAGPALLSQAIETVNLGEEFIDPGLKEQMVQQVLRFKAEQTPNNLIPELTQREKEILKLIAAEYTTKEISERLFISYRTAENHRYNLIQKLDVKNTVGLVKIAIQLGLA